MGLEHVSEAIANIELHMYPLWPRATADDEITELYREANEYDDDLLIIDLFPEIVEEARKLDKELEELNRAHVEKYGETFTQFDN